VTYEDREVLKQEGWGEAHADAPLIIRARGLEKVIEAHFERSLEAYHRRRPPHGGWNEYAASWLAANGARTDGPFAGLEAVLRFLKIIYPPPRRPRIAEGDSYWGTA
jgi:hypothetical protein